MPKVDIGARGKEEEREEEHIPDSAKERATEGIVVAAGPGRVHPETALQLDMPGFCHLSL